MKKVLLIILVGFTIVSILTIMLTIKYIPTFRDFDDVDDDGDNNDNHYNNSNLIRVNTYRLNNLFLEYEVEMISTFHYPLRYRSLYILYFIYER